MTAEKGIEGLLADLNQRLQQWQQRGDRTSQFILELGEAYAFICLRDLKQPLRFLRQLAGDPPVQFGPTGFRHELVDDQNPARHYTAFLWVGYWLPVWAAFPVLWLWEILGFIRYGGTWSQPDIRNGTLGIHHGRQVRRQGATVLPTLITRDLAGRDHAG